MIETKTYLKVVFKASYVAYVADEEATGRRKHNFQKMANGILIAMVKKQSQQENSGGNIGMQL